MYMVYYDIYWYISVYIGYGIYDTTNFNKEDYDYYLVYGKMKY